MTLDIDNQNVQLKIILQIKRKHTTFILLLYNRTCKCISLKLFKSIDQLKWLKPRRYCHLLMNAELRVQFVYSLLRTALPKTAYTLPILHCDQTVLWSMAKLAPKIDVISLSLLLKEFNFNFKMTRCFISQHAHTCICVCCLTLRETVFPEWWWNFGE